MDYPDQLKTPVRNERPGIDALDDFLWETASWDPAVEEFLEQARRVGADRGSAATARQLLDEQLVAEPAMIYRLVRLLAEAGELNPDHLAAACPGSPGGTRPGSGADPLGAALPLVGRETELFRGDRGATRRGAGVSVLCITGPAGIGKTRLARAIVTAIGRRAPVGHQLEVSLRSAAPGPEYRQLAKAPYDALAELLAQLRVREADIPATLAGRRARYAAELADRRPVILLDGVIDESQVLPLLPPRQGSVVVTGRAPLTGLNAHDVRRALQPGPRRADYVAGEEREAGRHLDPAGVLRGRDRGVRVVHAHRRADRPGEPVERDVGARSLSAGPWALCSRELR